MGLVLVLLVASSVRWASCAGFFDIVDIDDPLSAIWSQKQEPTTECKVTTPSGAKHGVCTSAPSCLLSGGQPSGKCNLFSTCCTFERTCGKSSSSKISYFEGDNIKTGGMCRYTIQLKTPHVCQVRLDFVKFHLAPAELTQIPRAVYPVYKCATDKLVITPNYYGIPKLCGNNDNQHVYIHVNQTDGDTKTVTLDIVLSDRGSNPKLVSPSWKIKVTQLECPIERNKFGLANRNADEAAQDFNLLAPLGAIQYFTNKAGYVKSFGYDGTVLSTQSYTYDQYYAIAFKRHHETCGVRFSPDFINLPHKASMVTIVDDDCYHYLFVPELIMGTELPNQYTFVSKVCLDTNREFKSYAPGPLYIHFNSRQTTDFETPDAAQYGFNLKYELLNTCT